MKRPQIPKTDAIVVGSGPNGLAAAIRLAQAGRSVTVVEAAETPGGGARSAELTLPGFVHDVCSSVFPMAVCSPYFRILPLREHGLEWAFPKIPLAHPLDDGIAAVMHHSESETATGLGVDGPAYQALIGQLTPVAEDLFAGILAPLRLPRHPLLLASFGLKAIRSVRTLARGYFRTERARALLAGIGGHAMLPLEMLTSAASALALAVAGHAQGWPFAKGGSQNLTSALVSLLRSLGGELITGYEVRSLEELPPARAVLFDVTPRQLLRIAGERMPSRYRRKLERFRYGMGVFKMDWALSEPVPWRATECRHAGTLHLGGTMDEISSSERTAWQGRVSERPFVLFAQATVADPSRAPAGKHTAWGYCHVPNGFKGSMVDQIEMQIERFAPGFRDCVMARSIMSPADLERHNPNLVGGDIAGGAPIPSQLFFRPTASMYRVPLPGVFLCSSSTPPAPGVHGMCGYFAAETALASTLA